MEVYELSASKSGAIAFIGEEKYRPAEVYLSSNLEAAPKRLTDFHHQIAQNKQGVREGITWTSTQGFEAMEYSRTHRILIRSKSIPSYC